MSKFIIAYLSIISLFSFAFAQSDITIRGSIAEVQQGRVWILRDDDDAFFDDSFEKLEDSIVGGKFSFSGKINHPEMLRVRFANDEIDFISEPFFIEGGELELSISSDESLKNDVLETGFAANVSGSKTQDEFVTAFLPSFGEVLARIETIERKQTDCDTISDLSERNRCRISIIKDKEQVGISRDSILHAYVANHPSSAIAPWLLKGFIFYHGYNDYLSKSFNIISATLSPPMRQHLDSMLLVEKRKAVGSVFPLWGIVEPKIEMAASRRNKYTLVDFWFSGCLPCIARFEELREVYEKYEPEGFEIVAISTDKIKNQKEYQSILREKQYPWKQILDLNGEKSKAIAIRKYPTTYLIDAKGVIIDRDLDPLRLEEYLKQNL
ncbi:AhpC/TSA family protein [Sphingobacterium shayense]|uniref:TlpA disulfide reductase family protein n=1 Tax=Sphingobacterium shayense TaxID=626343 RepID=UPI001555435F|nr:TlpA disulfide reductase family protein [Sphingobacterium shayense]NQD70412.1 AhpC/TSA family protein [Sphingobacterium shayense]